MSSYESSAFSFFGENFRVDDGLRTPPILMPPDDVSPDSTHYWEMTPDGVWFLVPQCSGDAMTTQFVSEDKAR